jgi:transcriptional regulator with XRE-family HTH domain
MGSSITTGHQPNAGESAMGSLRYSQLIEWFVTSEMMTLRKARGWERSDLGRAIGKHANTVRSWEIGERLPDKANISLICRELGADPALGVFMEHMVEQLNQGPGVVSDLDKRNLFLVEAAERVYGAFTKWDPVVFPSLLQTEAVHMKLFADPIEDPARKIKNWKRKERRSHTFFSRFDGADNPAGEFFVPTRAFTDLELLTRGEKTEQLERLIWVDSLPGCEVLVVPPPHIAVFPFDSFRSAGSGAAGPDFVYVETLDQSRHVVEPQKLALYDQTRSLLRADAQGIGRFLDGGIHRLA